MYPGCMTTINVLIGKSTCEKNYEGVGIDGSTILALT